MCFSYDHIYWNANTKSLQTLLLPVSQFPGKVISWQLRCEQTVTSSRYIVHFVLLLLLIWCATVSPSEPKSDLNSHTLSVVFLPPSRKPLQLHSPASDPRRNGASGWGTLPRPGAEQQTPLCEKLLLPQEWHLHTVSHNRCHHSYSYNRLWCSADYCIYLLCANTFQAYWFLSLVWVSSYYSVCCSWYWQELIMWHCVFPSSLTIVCQSWEKKPGLEEPSHWFESPSAPPFIFSICVQSQFTERTAQYQLLSIHEPSACALYLSITACEKKSAYGSEPALFSWPSAESFSWVQCCESHLNVK